MLCPIPPSNEVTLSRGSKQALLLTLTVWLVFVYGSYAVSELISGSAAFVHDLPLDLPAVLLVALVAFLLYPVAERTAGRTPFFRWLVENRLLGTIPAIDLAHLPLIRERLGRNFLGHLYLSIATGALLVFLVETRRTDEQRVKRLEAETLAADARTAALSFQLNPHFLFNSLNAISSLILSRDLEEAEAMVTRLAGFLRRTLKANPAEPVPLSEELASVAAYLEIEAIRFEERLRVVFDCPATFENVPVPAFILQPLVENAVKYGVARSTRAVTVRIGAQNVGDRLIIRVENNGPPTADTVPAQGLGIGLNNVRERLANRYGTEAGLNAGPNGAGFTNEIWLPLPL
jgi:sensor histidine kinase YesM